MSELHLLQPRYNLNIQVLIPFKSFASDPGNIKKLGNFKFSNKLYEESLHPIILSGKFLTSFVTASTENL